MAHIPIIEIWTIYRNIYPCYIYGTVQRSNLIAVIYGVLILDHAVRADRFRQSRVILIHRQMWAILRVIKAYPDNDGVVPTVAGW